MTLRETFRFSFLVSLPMGLAALGACLDEQRALGFTIWRGACRAAGLSPRSLLTFTIELLPLAVIGALSGGLLVLAGGFALPRRQAHGALAAHVGCVAAMPLGVAWCASALPLGATLVMEITTAVAITIGAARLLRAHP